MLKVDFREEAVNVALAELLEQRGLSEGRYVANVVDGKVNLYGKQGRRIADEFLLAISVRDRKSTRLNSSHGYISYAVFCLKKKNTIVIPFYTPHPTIHIGQDLAFVSRPLVPSSNFACTTVFRRHSPTQMTTNHPSCPRGSM